MCRMDFMLLPVAQTIEGAGEDMRAVGDRVQDAVDWTWRVNTGLATSCFETIDFKGTSWRSYSLFSANNVVGFNAHIETDFCQSSLIRVLHPETIHTINLPK